jgi:hypothetical protein
MVKMVVVMVVMMMVVVMVVIMMMVVMIMLVVAMMIMVIVVVVVVVVMVVLVVMVVMVVAAMVIAGWLWWWCPVLDISEAPRVPRVVILGHIYRRKKESQHCDIRYSVRIILVVFRLIDCLVFAYIMLRLLLAIALK